MKTVADIMQRDVTTVRPEATLRELTRLLTDRHITGAPVVDENGTLVGVVSATDVVRRAAEDGSLEIPPDDPVEEVSAAYHVPEESDWEVAYLGRMELSAEDRLTVADIMTEVSFGVSPDTSIREVADFLVRGRIHRAVVLDGTELAGIVTTLDVLRAVSDGLVSAE